MSFTLFPDGRISADTVEEFEQLLTELGHPAQQATETSKHDAPAQISQDTVNAVLALIAHKEAELLEAERTRDEAARQVAAAQAEVDALRDEMAPLVQSVLEGDEAPAPRVILH